MTNYDFTKRLHSDPWSITVVPNISQREHRVVDMFFRVTCSLVACLLLTRFSLAVERQSCPESSCPKPHDSLDLSPLQGTWQALYFAESALGESVPRFFNLSVCGPVDYAGPSSHCQDSHVCYSELLDRHYSLGDKDSCQYSYSDREVKLVYTYSSDASSVYGHGNVTVTLVCGRNLGVPEVVSGDPSDHSIEILWITSAACKTDTTLAASQETKCYTVSAYRDNGVKAKMFDLTNLIQTAGYEVTYPARKDARFLVAVCRPIQSMQYPQCNGSMACLIQSDPKFELGGNSVPLKLASINGSQSNLQIERDFPIVRYTGKASECDSGRKVKINYLCPVGNEDLGPTISFLDDKMCLVVISWFTFYACGTDAIQSTGCTLTTGTGMTFDLTGLAANLTQVNGTASNKNYTFAIQVCSGNKVNTQCGVLDSAGVRVAQIDYNNHGVCHSLGKGDGKLRYADGILSLTYEMGDSCHSNFHRTSIINFICPERVNQASDSSQVRFLSEDDCLYEFEWTTPLACGTQTSGVQDCQFEHSGNKYNFAPLVGETDKNWVAIDDVEDVECYMVNPCGQLFVTKDSRTAAEYCNDRVAPQSGCVGCSVCQIQKDGGTKCIGKFDIQNSNAVSSLDGDVLTIRGNSSDKRDATVAVMHYVCKTGDFSTPPVFVDITNDRFYEFHWTTMAACPLGIHIGDKCTVQHESTGYVFNVSSLSPTQYGFDAEDKHYHYGVSICHPLKDACHEHAGAGACQKYDGHERSLGDSNSALTYSDGTLFLQYRDGDGCSSGGSRNATILLECDSQAHQPTVAAVNEVNHCDYAIELHTKLACPPAYRATECIHLDKSHTYDFSELAKSIGNWQTEDSHKSVYYINLCQPLNRVAGCSPLSAVCRQRKVGDKVEYTNLGLASSASFSVAGESENEKKSRVILTYTSGGTNDKCTKVYSRIEFICSPLAEAESGPVYQSGGDEDNPCEYSFTWETPGACPVQPAHSSSCSVRDPESGRLYDLSPVANQQNHFTVTSDDGQYNWDIALCGPLNYTCHDSTKNMSVCQRYDEHQRTSGLQASRTLQFYDGSLSMQFTGGDKCNSNGRTRSTLINFECDRTVVFGEPRYIKEVDCEYSFQWPTALACPHKELECVAGGGRYDLRPLLHYENWMVTTSGRNSIVVGGCSALNFKSLPRCPQEPGMGACLFPNEGSDKGWALGYLLSDITEEVSGVLKLSYYNGAKCPSGKSHTVNIFFQCEKGSGPGVPIERDSNVVTCVTNIDWLTQYACPLDAANPHGWNITNPVTHQNFDLRDLSPSLSQIFVENGDSYNYTVGLAGHQIECGSLGWDYKHPIGSCQTKIDTGKSFILGRVNSSLQFVGEELRTEYGNGNFCHHVNAPRKTVLTFVCNRTAPKSGYLEVLPEEVCEYTFNIHTPKACKREEAPSSECFTPGYATLSSFTSLHIPPVSVPGVGTAYLAVCGAVSADNQVDTKASSVCPYKAAACLVADGKASSLGVAATPPAVLREGGGVVLEYANGSTCKGEQKWKTVLVLSCDRDIPTGVPELVTDSSDDCTYTFTWRSALACPVDIYSTNFSSNICSYRDPDINALFTYQAIASKHVSIPDSDTKYHVQLCGSMTEAPKECGSDVGICRTVGKDTKTLVHANHKFVITSHSPHIFEVVYDSGETCNGEKQWTAVVTLACKWRGGTSDPVFLSADDCNLRFIWRSSLFCVGPEMCAAKDEASGYTYDLDGLLDDTWSGLVFGQDGRFDLGVCRNINPFTTGPHCSSPAGVCWHKSESEHINLGHMTGPPVFIGGASPYIILNYTDGDACSEGAPGEKHSTLISLTCGPGKSTPLSLEASAPCRHTLDWETPHACKPSVNYTSTCVWSDTASGLQYNLSSLATPVKISAGDKTIEVCLCPSAACSAAGGAAVTASYGSGKMNWGKFSELSVSTVNSGPTLTYTGGNVCRGSATYKTVIFMECDRSSSTSNSNIRLQETVSQGCTKYLFWSTPYACHSEHSSCTHTAGDVFYDFTPLQVNPGEKAWTVNHRNDQFFVNLCGSIPPSYTGCYPDTAVCVHTSKGEWHSIGMASTQQIISTSDKHVQMKFSGRQQCRDSYSHVIIDMVCGLGGLTFHGNDSCTYEFMWHTPYACKVDDSVHRSSQCEDHVTVDGGISFLPNKLKSSTGLTAKGDFAHGTFYVSVCGHNSHCSEDSSVCYTDSDEHTHNVASFRHQTIIIQGTAMWIGMNSTDGLSHAIVNVECVDGSADISRAETIEFDKVTTSVAGSEKHTFYYFNMWTSAGCSLSKPTAAPPTSTPSNHHNNDNRDNGGGSSGGSGSSHSGSSSTVVGILVTVVVLVVAAIVLGFVFYKKDRRDRVLNFFKNKSSETVKYERLPMTRTEETSLLEEGSSDSDHGEGSEGEEGEEEERGGGKGGKGGKKRKPDRDEELIDL